MRGGVTNWTRHLKSRFGYSLPFAPSGVPAVPEPVHAIPAPEQGERRFGNTQATAVGQAAGADTKEKPDVRHRGVLPEHGRQSVAGPPEVGQRCGGAVGTALN